MPYKPYRLSHVLKILSAGIPPHVDTHSAFVGGIISLSLGFHVILPVTTRAIHTIINACNVLCSRSALGGHGF